MFLMNLKYLMIHLFLMNPRFPRYQMNLMYQRFLLLH
jgi:hypothetical protein